MYGALQEPEKATRTVLCNVVFIDFTFWTSLASCLVRFLYLCNESNKMLQMCSFWSWVIRQSGFHHLCFNSWVFTFSVFLGFFEQATVSWAQPTRETAPMPPVRRKVRRSSFQVRAFFWFFLFLGGLFFYDTGGSATWWGEECMEVCVNRWLRSECGHWQNKGMAS